MDSSYSIHLEQIITLKKYLKKIDIRFGIQVP